MMTMLRNVVIILGALLSIALGFAVFQVTGLFNSCESYTLKCALTGAIILTYLISYANGVRSRWVKSR